jgi:hypothetical protein
LDLSGSDENPWHYGLILDTGFQPSLFQSFAPASWILDVSGFHHRLIPEYPASRIEHPRYRGINASRRPASAS